MTITSVAFVHTDTTVAFVFEKATHIGRGGSLKSNGSRRSYLLVLAVAPCSSLSFIPGRSDLRQIRWSFVQRLSAADDSISSPSSLIVRGVYFTHPEGVGRRESKWGSAPYIIKENSHSEIPDWVFFLKGRSFFLRRM